MRVCCEDMRKSILEYKIIEYEAIFRSYGISFDDGYIKRILICPWCGINLGTRLASEYFRILEKEYNIEVPDLTNFTNIPQEFKTDEWWRKRDL